MTTMQLAPFWTHFLHGTAAIGTWLKLPTLASVEILAEAGFDFFVVDMEHAPLTAENAYGAIVLGQALGITVLVRVRDHGSGDVQRILDSGASGVLVPHISTALDAETVIRRMLFEPRGTRGIGSTSRAGKWGQLPSAKYVEHGNESVARIPQIEDREGVMNVEEILEVDGVNGIFVGPADLSASLGLPRDDPEVSVLSDGVLSAAKLHSIPCGTAVGTPEAARAMIARGFSFVMVSNDASLLAGAASNAVEEARKSL